MFSKTNNRRVQSSTILKTAAAAAVAVATGLGFAPAAMATPASVTAISTTFTAGSPLEALGVSGSAGSQEYSPSTKYNIIYDGGDLADDTVTTAGQTYLAQTTGTTYIRRNSVDPDTEILSYQATPSGGSNIELLGEQSTGYSQAYGGNNLLVGADNIFTNTGDGNGDNTSVERVDSVNFAGITVGSNVAFTVFDRSAITGDPHDGFQIAAITAVAPDGTPTDFGPLETIATGSYGQDPLLANGEYVVLNKNITTGGANAPFQPAAVHYDSTFGGVVIPTTDLASAGQTIYGYSLFALDTTGSGTELADWTNSTYYPTNTDPTEGGLDPLSIEGVTLVAVPEPASLGLLGGAALLALGGRRRRVSA